MHYIDSEATRKFIIRPNLNRHKLLSDNEKSALRELICDFKHDQFVALAMQVVDGLLPLFMEYEADVRERLLKLAILDVELSPQQQLEIFTLKFVVKEEDKHLKEALSKILKPDEIEQAYQLVYGFRHKYFLGKYDSVSANANSNGFPVRIADTYLAKGHAHVSKYLRAAHQATSAAKDLITKAYPEHRLKQKIFRRDAHEEVQLSIYEIQALIVDAVQNFIAFKQVPRNLKPVELASRLKDYHEIYTARKLVARLSNENVGIIGDPNFLPGTVDHYTGKTLIMYALQYQQDKELMKWGGGGHG